jgi:hypothetical protein
MQVQTELFVQAPACQRLAAAQNLKIGIGSAADLLHALGHECRGSYL